jgi:3',5'-cyclic AMP phosphodiesterase CpdA
MMGCAAITADLHLGITPPGAILHLKEGMMKKKPEVIIIAGDIGEPIQNFKKCLSLFSDAPCPVGVVIGNHDLYNTDGRHHSEELWGRMLRDAVKEYGCVWMEDEAVTIGDTTFIGSMAWYDYTSRDPRLSHLPDDFLYSCKGKFVSDGNYIDWERDDREFAAALLDGLVKRIEVAQGDPSVRRIAVVTHVPLFPEQMVHYRSDNPYSDAYFGNFTGGKEVSRFSKVMDVVSGHTHRGVDKVIGNIRVRVVPSDYRKPAFITLEM